MAESKKFSVRTDNIGQNVFVTDVFLLSVPEEERTKALSINDDGRVVLTTVSGSGGGTTDTGSLLANASVNSNILTFTRGDSTTFNLTVNTGSGGGSTNTGSLLTTASVSLNTITFTKGDASTFNIIVNTGSDQFTGTVTSVGGAGTVNGITLSGTVTTSGNLTLGGSVSINNSNWSGTDLSVANGGTGASTFTSNALLTGNGTSAIQAESNLTFNGSTLAVTGNVTATSFTGSLLGTATTSSTIIITDAPTAPIVFYPTFTLGTSGAQILRTDSSTLTYQPSIDTLTVANLAGTASLATTATTATTASTITVTDTATGVGPYYLAFTSGTSGAQILRTDSSTLTFNATSNTLTVANLAGTASVATNIAVTDAGGDTSTYILLAGSQTGNQGAKTDGSLTYNATTNTLSTTNFAGNASTADIALTSSTVNVSIQRSEARPFYPTFVDIVGGDNGKTLYYDDSTFSYNPSTDTLTVTSSYALTASYLEGGGGGSYTLPSATSTVLGGIKLEDNAVQTSAANIITTNAGKTYGLQVNASGQGVINVPWTDTVYTLPEATSTVRGGIELFSDTDNPTVANAVTSTTGKTYGLQLNSSGQGVINVPWTDTNTTYTAGSGLSLGGTTFSFDGVTSTLSSRTYKPVGESQTTSTNTSALSAGYLYPLNAIAGTITITLRASTPGYEFDFFVTNLDNQIDFSPAGGQTVISENGLKANSTGSAITAKALDSTTWALVGSLKV